ncbi:MAG: heat-inducible transcriptional repressor HrcA [Bryobacteraceae bacterium]
MTDGALTPRSRQILQSIVKAYIDTGEPVASRTLSRRHKDNLSPASIRNSMAELAGEGYLDQPHTSAGRIPTEKAFRVYVQSVTAARVQRAQVDRLRAELAQAGTVEARLEHSSHLLTQWTRGVGIAAAIPASSQILEHIELVALAEGRVLLILVTRDRMLRERIVHLDEPVTQDELASIRNYVNLNFSGWSLREARAELLRRIDLERATYDAILRKMALLYHKGLLEADASPEVRLDGASNLAAVDLHLTRERLRELFRALEQKTRIVELLDRFLEASPGAVHVQVGLEEAHPAMKELALIGIAVPMAGGVTAKIAVLGPMRMQYEKVMGVVLHLGRAFESA